MFSNQEELFNSSMNSALFGKNGLINAFGRNQFKKKRFSSQVTSPRMMDSNSEAQALSNKDVMRRIQAIQHRAGILEDPAVRKPGSEMRDSDQSPFRITNLQTMKSQHGGGNPGLQLPPINGLSKNATIFNSFDKQRNSPRSYNTINLDLQ